MSERLLEERTQGDVICPGSYSGGLQRGHVKVSAGWDVVGATKGPLCSDTALRSPVRACCAAQLSRTLGDPVDCV